jgi:type II secretory pathway component GspD/PulD (secretin)
VGLLYGVLAQAGNTVIEIQYADAYEVAEALDGLVEAGGSIQVYQNRLIIRAGPKNTAELKGIIEILDETPRKLLISVKSPSQTVTHNGVFKVSGNTGNESRYHNRYSSNSNGDSYTVRNSDGTITQSTVRLSSYSRGGASSSGSAASYSVQALEGHNATIQLAAALPGNPWAASQQGFYVNARVHGQQVVISLRTNNDSLSKGQLETAGITTRVQGKLGTWLAVGSLNGVSPQSNRSLNSMAWNNRSSASVVYVKVELLE